MGEAGFGQLLGHAFVVPHPEVPGSSEDGGGDRFEAAWRGGFTEPALLHKAGAGGGGGIAGVEADEWLEVREDEAKGASGTEIGEDVPQGSAELVEAHVLEDVGAVDGVGGLRRDRKAFDDIAVADVFGVRGKLFFYEQWSEKWEAALQPECGAGIEVLPSFRSTHTAPKLHVLVTHRPYYYIA